MILPGTEIEVERARIPEYFRGENAEKMEFYSRYKMFGWPFSGGWAEQPAYLVDIVECLEIEASKRMKKRIG
jgi:hypothetical protein